MLNELHKLNGEMQNLRFVVQNFSLDGETHDLCKELCQAVRSLGVIPYDDDDDSGRYLPPPSASKSLLNELSSLSNEVRGVRDAVQGKMFKLLAGLVQVPYRGAGPAIADLISGQVAMAVVAVTGQSLEFHRSGKLRILAVTNPERLIAAPELPTVADAGFPGLTSQTPRVS